MYRFFTCDSMDISKRLMEEKSMKNILKMASVALLATSGFMYSNQAAVARILNSQLNGAHVYALVKHATPVCMQNFVNHDGSGKELCKRGSGLSAFTAGGASDQFREWAIPANLCQLAVDGLDNPIKDNPAASEAKYNQAWINHAKELQAVAKAKEAKKIEAMNRSMQDYYDSLSDVDGRVHTCAPEVDVMKGNAAFHVINGQDDKVGDFPEVREAIEQAKRANQEEADWLRAELYGKNIDAELVQEWADIIDAHTEKKQPLQANRIMDIVKQALLDKQDLLFRDDLRQEDKSSVFLKYKEMFGEGLPTTLDELFFYRLEGSLLDEQRNFNALCCLHQYQEVEKLLNSINDVKVLAKGLFFIDRFFIYFNIDRCITNKDSLTDNCSAKITKLLVLKRIDQVLNDIDKSKEQEWDNMINAQVSDKSWQQFVKDNKEPLIAAGIVVAGGAGLYAGKKKLQKEAVEA